MRKYLSNSIKRMLMSVALILVLFIVFAVLNYNSKITKDVNCNSKNISCPENYTCDVKKQECVVAEKCPDIKPEVCITLYDPVCADGIEYSNSCFACMKVKYYYKGKC